MGSRQATGNMFRSLIKPLTPCVHQAPFFICSFYTLYIYTFRRPLPMPCWMTVSKEEEPVMLAIRLLFSSWTLVDGEMGIASQVLGSYHLMFRSLSDRQVKCAGQLRTYSHQVFLPLAISETGKREKLHATPLAMFRRLTSYRTEHLGLPHSFHILPYIRLPSCELGTRAGSSLPSA